MSRRDLDIYSINKDAYEELKNSIIRRYFVDIKQFGGIELEDLEWPASN